MSQESDVGTKDVEPLTPFDWKERLLELAAGLDEQKTPAGCRAVVGLDAPTLTALAEAIDGLMRRNTWLSDAKVQKDASCSDCVHGMAPLRAIPCRGCHYDPAKPGYSRVATEYRPDSALEGGRHE